MSNTFLPYKEPRTKRSIWVVALVLAAFGIGWALLAMSDGDNPNLAKDAEAAVLGKTVVPTDAPVLIPPGLTVPPTTELVPLNTLPPGLAADPPATTAAASTEPPAVDPWEQTLIDTISAHPVLDGRQEDELRVFVDSVCNALEAGATDDFITRDLAQQADEKGWTAELLAGVEALVVSGTAARCPAA